MKELKALLLSLVTGFVTSILAAYVYAGLRTTKLNPLQIGISTVAASALIWLAFLLRHKARLLTASGILAFYPEGQSQYIESLVSDLRRTRKLIIVGARGKDLVGEDTPIGKALSTWGEANPVQVFLIDPEGNYGRLRSGHLDVERDKYQAECQSIQHYIELLKIQSGMRIELRIYSSPPRVRMVMLDSCAYVAFYSPGTRGRDLPAFKISAKKGPAHRMLEHYIAFLEATSTSSSSARENATNPINTASASEQASASIVNALDHSLPPKASRKSE